MDNLVNNHYLLANLVDRFSHHLTGGTLVDCYTLSRSEVVFQARKDGRLHYLSIYIAPTDVLLQTSERRKPGKGTRPSFPELTGKKIIKCGTFSNDRSFFLTFEGDLHIVIKCYGGHGNIILYEGADVKTLFRPQFSRDGERSFDAYHNRIQQYPADYREKVEESGDPLSLIRALYPTFSPAIIEELRQRGIEDVGIDQQWNLLQDLLTYLRDPVYYILDAGTASKTHPGIVMSVFAHSHILHENQDVLHAYNRYSGLYLKNLHFFQRKFAMLDQLKSRRRKLSKTLKNARKRLHHLEHGVNYRQQADLIMANLHRIPEGTGSIKLDNFYTGTLTNVNLKKGLTPQKNAERYYRKARNQGRELDNLRERIEETLEELEKVTRQEEEIKEEGSFREMKRRHRKEVEQEKQKESVEKFRSVSFGGYRIYIGKSARNNDELTLSFAGKDDLWLHAKDHRGSHVVVKGRGKDQFPQPVIEKAAQLAAYYSRGRTSGLCPVVYTLCKHVRKPKRGSAGSVVFERGETVLVEPEHALDEIAG